VYSNKNIENNLKTGKRNFPGSPVAKTPCSQYSRPESDPWSGLLFVVIHGLLIAVAFLVVEPRL